ANVNVAGPTWTDNCMSNTVLTYSITGVGVTSGPSTGNGPVGTRNFSVGTSTIIYTVSDGLSQATCTLTVTVNDNQTPIVTWPVAQFVNTDPGQCFATVSIPPAGGSDNCPLPTSPYSYRFTGTTSSPGYPAYVSGTI